jgi:protein ImuA
MGQSEEHQLVVAHLRDQIRRIERRPGRREGVLACGLPEIDGLLPGGGFPRGALSELIGGPASGKTAVAMALFSTLGMEALAAYVDARAELYPPAVAARGVDLTRLLVVRPSSAGPGAPAAGGGAQPWRAALWACEALLSSGAFAAIAMDVPVPRTIEGADAVARRLQAAAERGGAVGLWLTTARGGLRVPAAVRLELRAEGGRIAARRGGSAAAAGARAPGGGRAA